MDINNLLTNGMVSHYPKRIVLKGIPKVKHWCNLRTAQGDAIYDVWTEVLDSLINFEVTEFIKSSDELTPMDRFYLFLLLRTGSGVGTDVDLEVPVSEGKYQSEKINIQKFKEIKITKKLQNAVRVKKDEESIVIHTDVLRYRNQRKFETEIAILKEEKNVKYMKEHENTALIEELNTLRNERELLSAEKTISKEELMADIKAGKDVDMSYIQNRQKLTELNQKIDELEKQEKSYWDFKDDNIAIISSFYPFVKTIVGYEGVISLPDFIEFFMELDMTAIDEMVRFISSTYHTLDTSFKVKDRITGEESERSVPLEVAFFLDWR